MANKMYTLPSKLKLFSIILVAIGLVGIVYGFLSTPKTVDDVQHIIEEHQAHRAADNSATADFIDRARGEEGFSDRSLQESQDFAYNDGSIEHAEHVLHQLQARPWSATFTAAFFFMMLALGVLVFYAIQYVAKAGWSPGLYRIMEGITNYLLPGSIIVLLIVIFAGTNFFPWLNDDLVAEDKYLQIKSAYLNMPFFVIRGIIYVAGWNLYRYIARRNSLNQADALNFDFYRKNYNISVIFLAFFFITEAFMAMDWFMSMTPHWFSTLFPWYVFASMFVTAITALTLITIYLRSIGLVPFISNKHLHDLAKYIFAFSIFWTYLWFSQFMLIWYANIPEEAAYFTIRVQEYGTLFFGMLIFNFVFPLLILMNSDFKRIPWLIVITGIFVLIGHYVDIYLLIMPSTVGAHYYFGIPEIGAILFFLGLFILLVGIGLGQTSLDPGNDPYIKESKNYHF